MIPLLEPIFKGDWATLGDALACAHTLPPQGVPVAALLSEPGRLGAILRQHARHLGVAGQDLRPAASAWSLAYLEVLLPPMVAAASVLQHVFPAQAACISVLLGDDAAPRGFCIPHEGQPLPGTDTAMRFELLLDGHLEPLFMAIGQHSRLPGKILWGNLARCLDKLFEHALRLTGHAAHVARDRDHLLHLARWPGGRANPLHAPQRMVAGPGAAAAVKLHRQCCLTYLLPGQGYCGACPLVPRHLPVKASAPST